jgi:large subunit ribosomal protein L7/L12
MASSAPTTALRQCCTRTTKTLTRTQKRSLSSQCLRITSSSQIPRQFTQRRRWQSTDAPSAAASLNPKISSIVDQISQLTLLETADLVQSLKVRYFSSSSVSLYAYFQR